MSTAPAPPSSKASIPSTKQIQEAGDEPGLLLSRCLECNSMRPRSEVKDDLCMTCCTAAPK